MKKSLSIKRHQISAREKKLGIAKYFNCVIDVYTYDIQSNGYYQGAISYGDVLFNLKA